MKQIIIICSVAFLIVSCSSNAQDIIGDWTGEVKGDNIALPINFHISETDGNYSSTIDFLSQKVMGFKTSSTTFNDNRLIITIEGQDIVFDGKLKDGILSGSYIQRTNHLSFKLSRLLIEETTKKVRPQDPKKPYPYSSEEIRFTNPKANHIKLAGTLTLPKGIKNPPVAILITGTGAQNRDEEIFNHRPFLVLSDYLTRNGIAVLRYDDRGVGESEGTLKDTNSEDLATDVEAAIRYLKTRTDINPQKIGLIGHSEGGLIAPIVVSKDKSIAFIVSLAGTAADGLTLLLSQERRKAELRGVSTDEIDFNERILKRAFTIVNNENDFSKIEGLVQKDLELFRKENANNPYINLLTDNEINGHARAASNPRNIYFFKTNPKQFWTKVQCPILAINGDKDSQVSSKIHLTAIKEAIEEGGNSETTIKELKGLNHLFQTAKTGSVEEYEQIEETFSPKALLMIKDWVIAHIK